ncbi:MAG: ATP-binding protein [Nitrospirota bacterium]
MSYTDEQLEVFLNDMESHNVERKAHWTEEIPKKAREAICAFANDLADSRQPGVLFVGANDNDGTPSGLRITDTLLLNLANIKTDGKILPFPSMTVEKRTLKGADMAVVTVQHSHSTPVRCDGRICVRTGSRSGVATAEDERILNEKRRYRDRSFDVQPVLKSQLSDLSRLFFEEEYLPKAFAPDIIAANKRSYEQRLAARNMILSVDEPIPTLLGILALGLSPCRFIPCAYVQFLRIAGTKRSDPIQGESKIEGRLVQIFDKIDEKISAHNRIHVDIRSSNREIRTATYPPVALQQIIHNAIMHRSYENTNAPVHVYWFDDRIEITSPGGPFGAVTQENFGRDGISDYRNLNIAGVMKELGFVQNFGIGIQTAKDALKENGNPDIEFQVDPSFVRAIIRPRLAPISES